MDLVIRGGTVVDGSGEPGRRAAAAIVGCARGVEWSLVNGAPVLERGQVVERPAGERPGRVLRCFNA